MHATVEGEDDRHVKVHVTDNAGVEHDLTIEAASGEIAYHGQDGYADDPSERTLTETERGHQARRYAKWFVHREKGYETLPRCENPDSIVGAVLALGATSPVAIDAIFGDFVDRLRSHDSGDHVELPFEDADPDAVVFYRQDIYIDPDPLDCHPPLVEQMSELLPDLSERLGELFGEGGRSPEALGELGRAVDPDRVPPEFEIQATSDIHYLYAKGSTERTHREEPPLDREPDARVELMPLDPDVFHSTRQLLMSNMVNQIRDWYLLMGTEPPAPFQQGGLGAYEGMKKQQLIDMYDKHFLAGEEDAGFRP